MRLNLSRAILMNVSEYRKAIISREDWLTRRQAVAKANPGDKSVHAPSFVSQADAQLQSVMMAVYWNHKVDVRPKLPASWLKRLGEVTAYQYQRRVIS